MSDSKYQRFENLSFDDFRRMATDVSLSRYEKIGFPDSYRQGAEADIFLDISAKLPALSRKNQTVLDIGPGCADIPLMLIELSRQQGHTLLMVDSEEMLSQLPAEPFMKKMAGCYPAVSGLAEAHAGRVDVILCYSVLHYVFADSNVFDFLDAALSLLSPGGQMLIGDVPNISMRKRFFSSANGIKFHQNFMQTQEEPIVTYNQVERHQIDDSVIFSLLVRARHQGFDSYVLPQPSHLPMANRREDILIKRP